MERAQYTSDARNAWGQDEWGDAKRMGFALSVGHDAGRNSLGHSKGIDE
jgi:hypothetical protein